MRIRTLPGIPETNPSTRPSLPAPRSADPRAKSARRTRACPREAPPTPRAPARSARAGRSRTRPTRSRRARGAAAKPARRSGRPSAGRAENPPSAELDALRERQIARPVDRVRLAPHVDLPGVRAGFASPAGVLLAAESAADLGSRGADVHV